jgi:hypothetical protein
MVGSGLKPQHYSNSLLCELWRVDNFDDFKSNFGL